ncbi:MAG TPA: PorV/PorQ family protein [Gemmatimonadales bacterium]|nr:PorV/PorQ family protein [Gemmatimonadales bacterium]
MTQSRGRAALLAAWLAGATAPAVAQTDINPDNTPFGTTAAEFLLLGAGARGTALGGAFAAIATDVSALYYNPAGVALMGRPGVTVSTYDYVADTRYSWGGIAFPFSGGARAIGLQIGTFGFKDQPVYTVEQPDGTGSTYSVSETFIGLTYAENFSDRFSAGLTAKGIFDKLGETSGEAFAVDFGTNFHAMLSGHPIKFSFVLANLGTNLSYSGDALNFEAPRDPLPGEDPVPEAPQPGQFRTKDFPLPTVFRVGLAYDLVTGEANRLTLLADFNQPNNNQAGFTGGAEWASQRLGGSPFGVALRGSYSYAPANDIGPSNSELTALEDEENLQGLAFGGGLSYTTGNFSLGVDYAWKYMGVLGGTNFLSLSLGW